MIINNLNMITINLIMITNNLNLIIINQIMMLMFLKAHPGNCCHTGWQGAWLWCCKVAFALVLIIIIFKLFSSSYSLIKNTKTRIRISVEHKFCDRSFILQIVLVMIIITIRIIFIIIKILILIAISMIRI